MARAKYDVKLDLNEQTIPILEQISDGMPGGFFIYHADGDGELIYLNKSMLRIFGCDTRKEFEELTGNTFKGLVHPEDYENVQKSIELQIENSSYDLDYVEYRIIQKDGTIRWLEDYGHFVHTDVYGEIFYVFVEDATERLQQRMDRLEKLNDYLWNAYTKERQYRKAILSEAVAFYEINLTKDIILTNSIHLDEENNEDLIKLMGMKSFKKYSECIVYQGRHVDNEEVDAYYQFFNRERLINCYQKGEMEQIYDCWMTDAHGRRKLVRYAYLLGENEHTGDVTALAIAKNMMEQVERQHLLRSALQQAKVASVARETFLSNMSHDIRTPLNAIIGYAELIKKHLKDSGRVEDYIEKIANSGQQLLSIVNESLEVTRMESGEVSLTNEAFDMEELLDEVTKILRNQIKAKKTKLVIDKSGLKNSNVISDFMRIKEVLYQLLDNAVKYTDVGGNVKLTITENDIYLKGYRQYRFVVEDNGCGISERFIDKIYEPFARENNTTKSGVLGPGLGLSLVKNIIDMLDGDIEIKSKRGEGSCFTVTMLLRLQEEHAVEEQTAEKQGGGQMPPSDEICILLAEDNEINREIVEELLGDSGYTVESAENGSIVLEKLKNSAPGHFSMILMDIQMPVMDGYETTRQIRKLENQELAQIPIVALSANAFAEDFQRSREAGMNAHVAKPLNMQNLFEVMESVLISNKIKGK
ncbi:MAG: response regulator [Clostridium sp.]|nr:response regulator [Clostridium sp.]MCM1399705.1 response regulator [Clostridium sp.]MCM1460460.1 response regulator [Bacteroides sp.]